MPHVRSATLAYPPPERLAIEHSQANPLRLSLAWDADSEMPSSLTLRAEIHPSRSVANTAVPLAAVTLAVTSADVQPWSLEFSSQQTNLDLGGRDRKDFVLTITGIESSTRLYTLADADLTLLRHPCSQLVPAAVSPLLYATTEALDEIDARLTVVEESEVGGGAGATNLTRTLAPTSVAINSSTGTSTTIPAADDTNAGVFPAALHTKLTDLPTAAALTTSLSGKSNTGHAHSIAFIGDVTGSGNTGADVSLTIGDGKITTAKIADAAVTFSKIASAAIGTGATQIAAGNDSRFHAALTLASSVSDIFTLSGQDLRAGSFEQDTLVFFDQSAAKLTQLTLGAGLTITGTVISAPAAGSGSELQVRDSVTGALTAVAGTSISGTTVCLGAADNLGAGTAERLRARNTTPSANGAPQNSPAIAYEGSAWNTGAAASQKIEYRNYLKAAPGGSTPVGQFVIEARTNEGTWTEVSHFRFGYSASGIWSTSGFGSASSTIPFWVSNSIQAMQLGSTGNWIRGPFSIRTGSSDATLEADAAHQLAQRSGTNAQVFRVYDTFASATDYQRVSIATARAVLSGLSGASVTATALIPAGAVVMGVTAKVLTAITGATSWQLGTAADPDRFAATGGIALGSTTQNSDWTSNAIECFPSGANLILTANGSNFTGGSIQISVQFLRGEAD
jgi:hypothetical protein